MFALHEATRKRVCRTAFIVLCVAPTLATAAWIVERRLPSRTAVQTARLGGILQTKAALLGYSEPRPGSLRCREITLDDSTTGESLVRLEGARLHGHEGEWSITAEAATVDAENLDALAAKVAAWLTLPELQAVELRIGRLTLAQKSSADSASAQAFKLVEVQGRIDRDAAGVARLRLAGRPADAAADDKSIVRLAVERTLAGATTTTHVTLQSSATELPTAMLAAVVPGLDGLNAEAVLTGGVEWIIDSSGAGGTAQGRLDKVALSSLLPAGSPHTVNGRVTVSLTELRWRSERLERLEAAATAEDVEVSPSLIAAAVKFMYCAEAAKPSIADGEAATIVLERLACHFVLDHRGFTVFGDLPQSVEAPTGCLATSGDRPLVLQPPYVDIPVGAWVQFVAGPSNSWLPATDAAVRTATRLPLP